MTPTWDNTQALSEGWDLFWVDRDHDSGLEIERLDCPEIDVVGFDEPKFADDPEAESFVLNAAAAGSAYHQQALLWLALHAIRP